MSGRGRRRAWVCGVVAVLAVGVGVGVAEAQSTGPGSGEESEDNPRDLGVAMWKMRYSCSVKDYEKSLRLAGNILKREGLNAETVADVRLHTYFAQRKLGRDGAAAATLQGYLNRSVWAFPELDVVVCRVQSRPYLHATEEFDAGRMRGWIGEACGR